MGGRQHHEYPFKPKEMQLFKTTVIRGCESRGDGNSPYLTRYTLFSCNAFQLCVHVFHRSDSPELHDHPWNFWTLPLWRGYREEYFNVAAGGVSVQTAKVGLLYRRPAEHAHRVILHMAEGRGELPAVTLVLMTKRRREWGFFTRAGWQQWRAYFTANRC